MQTRENLPGCPGSSYSQIIPTIFLGSGFRVPISVPLATGQQELLPWQVVVGFTACIAGAGEDIIWVSIVANIMVSYSFYSYSIRYLKYTSK